MQQEEELPYDCELLPTQGAYNSVYNVQGATPPKVCRISVVPNVDVGKVNAKYPSKEEKESREYLLELRGDITNEALVLLYRARYMLTFLNRFPQLGPSIVKEIGNTVAFSGQNPLEKLRRIYNIALCDKVFEGISKYGSNYALVVQCMEKLDGPWKGTSIEEIFSLLWFFSTSQTAFHFRHRDLKPANLLTRSYEKKKKFFFAWTNDSLPRESWIKNRWWITVSQLPVVIDLDFATVSKSLFYMDRNRLGTYDYAPPDAICQEYVTEIANLNGGFENIGYTAKEGERFLDAGEDDDDGYDMWAIAMILLRTFLKPEYQDVLNTLRPKAKADYQLTFNSREDTEWNLPEFDPEPTKDYRTYLIINAAISSVVLAENDDFAFPKLWESEEYGFRYPKLVVGSSVFAKAMNNYSVKAFKRAFENPTRVSDQHRELIRYLMNWNPQKRGGRGRVLFDFSDEGRLFHPLTERPKKKDVPPPETIVFNQGTMDGNKHRTISKEDVPHLQMKI
jgi:serine/threonine protein kinase